ncbi:MAG TPA: bifunctional hydroxymethylpyrimidine kinase/phosphomethylpyrimidine kinase [Allosphingosinicella sp.]
MTPRILIIAGSDSGGGAGIQADIKTVTMLGGFAMTAITALTAQNTLGVTGAMPVPAQFVLEQMDAVLGDLGADVVKIGMIGSPETVDSVAGRLEGLGLPVVFDPVMVATSGSILANEVTIAAFDRLMKVSTLVTPNAPELAALTGLEVDSLASLEKAARALAARTRAAVLAKGGHLAGEEVSDLLARPDGAVIRWDSPRIESANTHGTGCALASAVATGLAAGVGLDRAVAQARMFVRLALLNAPGLGQGHGPMGHHKVRLDLADGGPTLNQITLPATEYEASVAFYRLLGCRQIVAAPPRYARFEVPGGATLSIEVSDAPTSSAEIFFQCADVDAEVARLQAAGMTFDVLPEDRSYLWRVAETRDPHGNRICLYDPGEARRFPPWRVD